MRLPSISVALAAVIAAVAIAGCGGSSYPANADAVCKTYNEKINAVKKPTSANEVPAYLDQITPLFHQAVTKLKAVNPPSDKQSAFNAYVATIAQEAATLEQARSAKSPAAAIATIVQLQSTLGGRAKTQAKAAGLKTCAGQA